MAITYDQLQKATLKDFQDNAEIRNAYSKIYGGENANPDQLLGLYSSGGRNFDSDKAGVLGKLTGNGFISQQNRQDVDAYGNFNNANDPASLPEAGRRRTSALTDLTSLNTKYANYGFDFTSLPEYQQLLGRLGGTGTTAVGGDTAQMDVANNNAKAASSAQTPPGQPVVPVATPVVAPNQPAPLTPSAGLQFPSFQDSLKQIYSERKDLQELYNPDGSAKNQADPRLAGIPTLQDWAQKYGVNENPQLAQSLQQATASTNPTTPTSTSSAANATTGINTPASATGGSTDPISHVEEIYNAVYEKLGISSLKTQIEDYNKQLLTLRNTKSDEAQKINDNPWLTEGERVKRLNSLDSKYEQREGNLQGYMQMAQSLYNTGLTQANAMISDVNQLESDNRKYTQDLVDARYKLANQQPFYKYPGSDLVYSTATGTGLSYDQYIQLGGDPAFGNIFEIRPQSSVDEHTLVMDLAKQYDDAGILPSDSLVVAQDKQRKSATYLKSIKNTTKKNTTDTNPVPVTPRDSQITLTGFPKTVSENNIRNWLASNWHRLASQSAYYDVWGQATEIMKANGVDPLKFDKTLWDVFRPGEYESNSPNSKTNSEKNKSSTPSNNSSDFDRI